MLNPTIMQAVEQLNYRATIGDVAAQAGLDLNIAEQGLLVLASETGGHLQVAETGDIVYQFPSNFRTILRNKFWKLRLQEVWAKIWRILFYLIRVSFGAVLIASLLLIFIAIAILVVAANSSRDGDSNEGGGFWLPVYWIDDLFWVFSPDYGYSDRDSRRLKHKHGKPDGELNFLEAIFSFLFGDGNPNADREEKRWKTIAAVIGNNQGVAIAEQIAPYVDDLGNTFDREYEAHMLPVLAKFNGHPQVSPDGQIVYHFPDLQISATDRETRSVETYLRELPWRFSRATSGQVMLAIGLGALNLVGALMLGSLLGDGEIATQIGGLVGFVSSIYAILLGYGTGFLAIPLIRYFWVQGRNRKIDDRNQQRQSRAIELDGAASQTQGTLQRKLAYARQFATKTVITTQDLAYTTETDLIEQEIEQTEKIDAQWQQRLKPKAD
jgi:hypothetical protein